MVGVGGDFNLGHMDWETLSVFPGKPNQKQHQQFLDIINDNSLTQVVNKKHAKIKQMFVFSIHTKIYGPFFLHNSELRKLNSFH
jgi:hypothetical protein